MACCFGRGRRCLLIKTLECPLNLGFSIDQEIGTCDHAIALFQSTQNLVGVSYLAPQLNKAWICVPLGLACLESWQALSRTGRALTSERDREKMPIVRLAEGSAYKRGVMAKPTNAAQIAEERIQRRSSRKQQSLILASWG